jgi:hypothetical protein
MIEDRVIVELCAYSIGADMGAGKSGGIEWCN